MTEEKFYSVVLHHAGANTLTEETIKAHSEEQAKQYSREENPNIDWDASFLFVKELSTLETLKTVVKQLDAANARILSLETELNNYRQSITNKY